MLARYEAPSRDGMLSIRPAKRIEQLIIIVCTSTNARRDVERARKSRGREKLIEKCVSPL